MGTDLMEPTPLSRRKLLKRAGVLSAALWAAPVLTSSASAGHGGRHTCGQGQLCGGDPCFNQSTCRPPDGSCSCVQRTQPGGFVCFCHEFQFCDQLTPCDQGADCPPGWACAATCCGGLLCVPPCGTNEQLGIAAGAGRTTAG
jgi:hypothetical protein